MKVKPIPDDMHRVTPHLVRVGAAQAIEFYKKAFGAVEEVRLPGPDGRLMHAMIRIHGDAVMLVDEMPEWGALSPKSLKGSPVTLHLYVEDVDPFGHHWSVATHQRRVTMDEMQQAMRGMAGTAKA